MILENPRPVVAPDVKPPAPVARVGKKLQGVYHASREVLIGVFGSFTFLDFRLLLKGKKTCIALFS